jgi:hypothetical protein
MTDLTFPFAVIGALWLYWRFAVGCERLVERVQLWAIARRRVRPVAYIAPRMRVIAVPAVTRRKWPTLWRNV